MSWPQDKRTVTVEVKFRRPLPPAIAEEGSPADRLFDQRDLYGEDVESKTSMIRFLTRVTRSVDDGGKVKAPCPESLKDELYEAMEITASTPQPVEVEADDD